MDSGSKVNEREGCREKCGVGYFCNQLPRELQFSHLRSCGSSGSRLRRVVRRPRQYWCQSATTRGPARASVRKALARRDQREVEPTSACGVRTFVCMYAIGRVCVCACVLWWWEVGRGEEGGGLGVERAGSPPPLTVLSGRDLECVDYL